MKGHLFHPPTRRLPSRLLLVPFFADPSSFVQMQKNALHRSKLLGADLLEFKDFALIGNFLGYPFLLTLLEHVEGIRTKELFFLGTAGVIGTGIRKPQTLGVASVAGSGPLRTFGSGGSLEMSRLPVRSLKKVGVVSVDIPQRETRRWVQEAIGRKKAAVEMELFPLRVFLGKPFVALVVATDIVSADGIRPFADRKAVRAEFRRALELLMDRITREESHPEQAF